MFSSSIHDRPDPSLVELIEFSSQALLRKPLRRSPDAARRTLQHRSESRLSDAAIADPLTQWLPDYAIATPRVAPPSSVDLGFDADEIVIEWVYAPPIIPLRDRDLRALADFFAAADMERIEADVLKGLRDRYPEPCWDDDPFEFLAEYLTPIAPQSTR